MHHDCHENLLMDRTASPRPGPVRALRALSVHGTACKRRRNRGGQTNLTEKEISPTRLPAPGPPRGRPPGRRCHDLSPASGPSCGRSPAIGKRGRRSEARLGRQGCADDIPINALLI